MSAPLVSVGIPTYNRAAGLERAVRSALAQTHVPLEVVVSDNASTDGTEALCRELERRHANLRYLRQPENRGPTLNFMAALRAARGEYFLWLADDDWLDPGYVGACLAALGARPGVTLAAGAATLHDPSGAVVREAPAEEIAGGSGLSRVVRYLLGVKHNSMFYGVTRRDRLLEIGLDNVMGGDWLTVAALAARGDIAGVPAVKLHRGHGGSGTSMSYARIAATLRLPAVQGRFPRLTIGANLLRAFAFGGPRTGLGVAERAALVLVLPLLLVVKALANPNLWLRKS